MNLPLRTQSKILLPPEVFTKIGIAKTNFKVNYLNIHFNILRILIKIQILKILTKNNNI